MNSNNPAETSIANSPTAHTFTTKPMIVPSGPLRPAPWSLPGIPHKPEPWGGLPPNPPDPNAAGPFPWGGPAPWGPTPWNPTPMSPPYDPYQPCIPGIPTKPIFIPQLTHQLPKPEEHELYKRIKESVTTAKKHAKAGKVKRTHIIFVLDKSSSMLKGKDITISGFNEQVDIVNQKKKGAGRTTTSLVLFSSSSSVSYRYQSTKALMKLDKENYEPEGMTALYDAIGQAMELVVSAKGFDEQNTAFFIAILTDGGENYSVRCDGALVSKCMDMLQSTDRVTFSFMGPNSQLRSIADVLRVAPGNMAGFDPGCLKSRTQAFASMSAATETYLNARTVGATAVCNLYSGSKV